MQIIILYPRSLVEEVSSGFLRMKNMDSTCLDADLIHFPGACLFTRWGCNPTSDCQKMTSIHAAAFSEYSAKPTTHQALAPSAPIWLYCKSMFVTDPFIFSASAKAWRQRHIKVGVLLEGSMVKINWHFTETCESLWYKTWQTIQKSTTADSIYIFDNSPRSEMNDETTAPPNHLNLSLSKHSTEPTTHQALAPSAPIWLYCKSMFVMDLLICSASAKAWRQRQIKVGV